MPSQIPPQEQVEVVDHAGTVLRLASRAEMRQQNLLHRSTYVAVVGSDLKLVVHQRADWKDTSPGLWDLCFGGVAGVDEGWRKAALRELVEESGLGDVGPGDLVALGSFLFEGQHTRVVGEAFVVISDAELTCPDGEVVAVERVKLGEICGWVDSHRICQDSLDCVLPLVLDHFSDSLNRL